MKSAFPLAVLVSVSVLLPCRPITALAQDGDAAALRKKVELLELRLLDVESKLRNLEARDVGKPPAPTIDRPEAVSARQDQPTESQQQPAKATPPASTPTASVLSYPEQWLRIKEGMTQAEVKSLIGSAHRSFELNGSTVWYYAYQRGGVGSVFFDSTGHASGYQKPSTFRLW